MEDRAWWQLWNGKRATFLQWCMTFGIVAVCGKLFYDHIVNSWYGGRIPGWALVLEKWVNRLL